MSEEWIRQVSLGGDIVWISDADYNSVCDFYSRDRDKDGEIVLTPFPKAYENAGRVLIAVNATKDISTKTLQENPGVIGETVEALREAITYMPHGINYRGPRLLHTGDNAAREKMQAVLDKLGGDK